MRPLAASSLATLASLAVLASACSSPARKDPLPVSARDFAFSLQHRDYLDAARGTPANGDASAFGHRSLPTELWVPAGAGPFPLVLFVHGSSGWRTQSTFLLQALARDGYLVAAADFPLTALPTPGGASDWHAEDQLGDLRFLADRVLADFPAAAPGGYAVVGHSTGGTVALLAAQAPAPHDPRVRAAVVLSGDSCFLGDALFRTRAVPMLYVSATRDLLVPMQTNGARAYALSGRPRAHATLLGGTHLFFTDFAAADDTFGAQPTTLRDPLAQTLARWGGGTGCEPFPAPGTEPLIAFEAQHLLTARLTAAFLDEHLRGERGAFAAVDDPRLRVESDL